MNDDVREKNLECQLEGDINDDKTVWDIYMRSEKPDNVESHISGTLNKKTGVIDEFSVQVSTVNSIKCGGTLLFNAMIALFCLTKDDWKTEGKNLDNAVWEKIKPQVQAVGEGGLVESSFKIKGVIGDWVSNQVAAEKKRTNYDSFVISLRHLCEADGSIACAEKATWNTFTGKIVKRTLKFEKVVLFNVEKDSEWTVWTLFHNSDDILDVIEEDRQGEEVLAPMILDLKLHSTVEPDVDIGGQLCD